MGRPVTPPEKRFYSFIKRLDTGCWEWTGEMSNTGYGRLLVKFENRWGHVTAHRFAFELVKGPIPEGLVIDHICRNKKCVNPDHLRAVTSQQNILAGIGFAAVNAKKTHCPKGHEFTEENTERGAGNRRKCRICRREQCRLQREKKVMS